MTKINLPELKRLSKEATKAPWTKLEVGAVGGEDGSAYGWLQITSGKRKAVRSKINDALLIAQMRNSIDTLIGALEEARGALEKAENLFEEYKDAGFGIGSPDSVSFTITKLDAAIDFGSGVDK